MDVMKARGYSLPKFLDFKCTFRFELALNVIVSNLTFSNVNEILTGFFPLLFQYLIESAHDSQAMGDLFTIPEVVAHIPSQCGPVLRSVPSTARLNAYMHPWQFSLSERAKAGRYPSMHQTRIQFPSIVWKNYQASREAVEVKFDAAGGDTIEFFSVRYIDGHNKGIIVQTLLALVIYAVA